MAPELVEIARYIRSYPDFPKAGILFRDVMPLFQAPKIRALICQLFAKRFVQTDYEVIVGLDARGFILATLFAADQNKPLVFMRKSGKLPGPVYRCEYALEYGNNCIELQKDALKRTDRVLIMDDLLATGGTAEAAITLVEQAGATVYALANMIELQALGARERLAQYRFESLIIE